MDVLLDTHAVIWYVTKDSRLSKTSYEIIDDPANKCFISIASLWEMGIKFSIGKLELNNDLQQIFEIIHRTGFEFLPISVNHVLSCAQLPFHHRDPFDRIIIAQALTEKLSIITQDTHFRKYDVTVVWKK